jgi:mannose/fructose/N-acetylgalactosamine-specific phosphotransferase system component IIB
MHFTEGKAQVCDAVFLDQSDRECFYSLHDLKVALEVRMVPTDTKKDLMKAIEDRQKKK